MSSKLAKLAETSVLTREFISERDIKLNSGHGTLPSICPKCKRGALDFNRKGLICRDCKHQIVLD